MEQKNRWDLRQQIYNIARALAAKWHLICLAAVTAAVIGDLVLTLLYAPSFVTEASFAMKMPEYGLDGSEEGEIAEALQYILTSNIFMDQIREDLGEDEINGTYSAEAVEGTNIVKLSAQADSPRISYLMMYAMMDRYQEVTDLVIGDMKIEILEDLQVPLSPSNKMDHAKNMALFGLCGGAAAALLIEMAAYMRDTVKDKNTVKERLQIRLLAEIPSESKLVLHSRKIYKKKALLITQITTSMPFIESFRRLGERFEAEARKHGSQIVVVNSTMENEGKTSVAVNLVAALAQSGKRVLLIDGDLRKPAVGKILDMESDKGLEDVLEGEEDVRDVVCRNERIGADIVLSKKPVEHSSAVLEQGRIGEALDRCREEYDYILIDTPPAGLLGDPLIIAGYADAVLIVVRQDYTPAALINRTIERCLAQDTPVIGCVLNRSMPVLGNKMPRKGGGEYGRK